MKIDLINKCLDKHLETTGQRYITAIEANEILEKSGMLPDSKNRPGKPLRDLLRKGVFPHAYQSGGKGSGWRIPRSNFEIKQVRTIKAPDQQISESANEGAVPKKQNKSLKNILENLERARLKYKPEKIKLLLVAEAAPDGIDRFFYYEDVKEHDYLFLAVSEVIYPNFYDEYRLSNRSSKIKKQILTQFKEDGIYLVDFSELPLSYTNKPLESNITSFKSKIASIIDKDTKIILIKVNIYDIAFKELIFDGFKNVIDYRLPFPSHGNQSKFRVEFQKAIKEVQL